MTMRIRRRAQRGRLVVDDAISLAGETEVVPAAIVEDRNDLDLEDRARLHEALRASADQLDRGEVFPMEQVLAEL